MTRPREIAPGINWVGVMDPGLRVFDIVMETRSGTTYNSYLVRGDRTAVIDTVKERFAEEYLAGLKTLVKPEQIDYVNAHATATEQGDIAECEAISSIFGATTPVSSLKGHLGHAMAASGTLELAACIEMLRQGLLIPTLNLEHVDPRCANVMHLHEVTRRPVATVIKNNFALGGVNSSIILRRYPQ